MPIRVRLDIAYDGAPFVGWASQVGLHSVQGTIEAALATLVRGEPPRLTVAGRTDSGVHARGQVAHVDLPAGVWTKAPGRSETAPDDAFARKLNALIARELRAAAIAPRTVVIHGASLAARGFDARFSALWRRYVYRIADIPERYDPLARGHVLWHRRPLDTDAMREAAQRLLGEHDFLAYCKPRDGATTIRTLQRLGVRRAGGEVIEIEVQADAFCHSMVRALVGSLMTVGEGRADAGMPLRRLFARNHDGMHVAPAHGLTLEEVGYPPDTELADRATAARRRRDEPLP